VNTTLWIDIRLWHDAYSSLNLLNAINQYLFVYYYFFTIYSCYLKLYSEIKFTADIFQFLLNQATLSNYSIYRFLPLASIDSLTERLCDLSSYSISIQLLQLRFNWAFLLDQVFHWLFLYLLNRASLCSTKLFFHNFLTCLTECFHAKLFLNYSLIPDRLNRANPRSIKLFSSNHYPIY